MGFSLIRVLRPTCSERMSSLQVPARCTEFRGFLSSSRKPMEFLWEEFFRDPSQFYDVRHIKNGESSPDFRHKYTGKALWIDGLYTPPWVRVKLQWIELPCPQVNSDHDCAAVIKLIKSCGKKKDMSMMRRISADKGWITQDTSIANTLIRSYAKCGAVNEAREVFDHLVERDIISWNALIAGYVEQGFGEEALICFREMGSDKVTPNVVTFISTLKACAIVGALNIVEEIHAQVRQQGLLNKHIVLGTTLVNAYAKCGAMRKAQNVFDQLTERDVVTWGALIAGYADHGFGERALTCFRDMENDGVIPNSVAYTCSLKACAIEGALDIVKEIHAQVRRQGLLRQDITLGNALVSAYAKCGAVMEAQEVFDQLVERDVVSWNAIIAGYVDEGFPEQALTCFRDMQNDGIKPDSVANICSLKAASVLGALAIVEEIHAQVREQGLLRNDFAFGNALVNAYAKCGAVKEAWGVFNQLGECNIVAWSALLAGCAQLGRVYEMLELFRIMLEGGIFPDTVTFLVLLNGCSHGAFLEEGQKLFDTIKTLGIDPTPEHCTCMVDLFGRAGQLDLARCYVFDHVSALLAFLGACQKWVNLDLGRWAFEKLLQLDQNCSSAFVCMANIYAAVGMIKEAEEIESLRMKEFLGSKSHTLCTLTYSKLEELCYNLMKKGISPDLSWGSESILDHEKEKKLICGHVEKLGIAYALFNTSEAEPMRINTNLSVSDGG